MDHRNNFHLIRLLAAAQVMVSHGVAHLKLDIPAALEQVLNAFPGVPIFFIVSGFLISGSYARQSGIRKYAASRCLRIYPALWVNLVGITIMLVLAGSLAISPLDVRFWLWHIVAFVLGSDYLASNLIGGLFSGNGLFAFYPSGVLWTLPVELSFYLLTPLIFAKSLASRGLQGASLTLWAATSLLCFFLISRVGDWTVFIGLYLWIFLLGAAARAYWDRMKPMFERQAVYWLAGHLMLTLSIIALTGRPAVYVVPNWISIAHTCTLAGATVSCAYTVPSLTKRILGDRDISYGLYLWHMPVFCAFMVYGLTGQWWHFLLGAWIAVFIADLSRRYIEEPALTLKSLRKPAEPLQASL